MFYHYSTLEKRGVHYFSFITKQQVTCTCTLLLDARPTEYPGMIHLYAACLFTHDNFLTLFVSSDLLITSCCRLSWHYALQQLPHQQPHSAHADWWPHPLRTRPGPSGSLHQPTDISCVPKEIDKGTK